MGPNRRAQERERAAARAAAEAKRAEAERNAIAEAERIQRPVREARNADGGAAVMHLWSIAVIYAWVQQRTAHILKGGAP